MGPDTAVAFRIYVAQLASAHYLHVATHRAYSPEGAVEAWLNANPNVSAETLYVAVRPLGDETEERLYTYTLNRRSSYDITAKTFT